MPFPKCLVRKCENHADFEVVMLKTQGKLVLCKKHHDMAREIVRSFDDAVLKLYRKSIDKVVAFED